MSLLLLVNCGFFLLQPTYGWGAGDMDYWSEDFDTSKNCLQEKKIIELRDKAYDIRQADSTAPTQCSSEIVRDDRDKETSFRACKHNLFKQVKITCAYTAVNSSGDLIYCYNRGIITCCFENHSCVQDWTTMQHRVYTTSKKYLTDPAKFLNTEVRPMGYKTCHMLNSSLDATICAKDCDRLKKHKFAKDCKNRGGLYKCCIRRDKAFCHECRFCCTLSLCTYPSSHYGPHGNSNSVFDDRDLELKDQKNRVTASELFFSVQHMYKDWDYRCLVPYSHKDPRKWKTYEMHDYRKAFSEEKLKKVAQFKYDNNFHNWDDPKVLRYFAKSTKSLRKAWKKTYGVPYVSVNSWDGKHINPQNNTKCFIKCAKYEQSSFAKDCKKKGGFFKCCIQAFTLNIFETSRKSLIEEGLIKDKPTSYCKPGWERKDPCLTCHTDAMCTEMDILTGQTKHTFMKGYKPEHRVGGAHQAFDSRFGIRFNWCNTGDLCDPIQGWDYHTKKFRDAMTQKELCQADLVSIWGPNPTYDKLPLEKMKKEYHEYCPKSKSSNFIFCPKSIIKKKKDVKVQWINDYFNNFVKKSKKKGKSKKKSKKGKSKKKKKRRKNKKKKSKYRKKS